ncbi:MAG: hypothetical protein AAF206_28465, partial [Bacteroidota bacterium]
MERFTQSRAHVVQRYVVIFLETILLFYGFQLGNLILGGQWMAFSGEQNLLHVICILAWIGGGALSNYYHYESILHPQYLTRSILTNLGISTLILALVYQNYAHLFPQFGLSWTMALLAGIGLRFLIGYVYRHRRLLFSLAGEKYNVMIVGVGETAEELERFFGQFKGSTVHQF